MSSFKTAYEKAVSTLTSEPGSAFEIATQSIDGVDYKTLVNAPANIVDLFAPAREFGEREFLVYQDERWTFDDFFQQADQLAYQLVHQYKIEKGARVAIAMRNYPEWMTAFVAIISVGAIVVPFNSWGRAAELQYSLQDTETELVICDQQRYELIDFSVSPVKAIVVRGEDKPLAQGCISLTKLLAEVPPLQQRQALPEVIIAPEDTAIIMYTSGTSGKPKGAVITHRACSQAIVNLELTGAVTYMTNQEAITKHMQGGWSAKNLLAVPLFHISGLYSQFLFNLRGGRGLVLMYKWDPQQACKLIEQERITNVLAAPTMLLDMMQRDEFKRIDKSSIINVTGGGAASPERLSELRNELLPDAIAGAGYGMTESGGIGCAFAGAVARAKPTACGFVHPVAELRFCDEDGVDVAAGSRGEIWLKSPTNAQGYWNLPETTSTEFNNGWFKTGDIGYLDEDDCLHICDRVKDMVIRGGENIYPIEIENCILSMPGVQAVTAFAVPSEAMGEELAVVVRPNGPSDLDNCNPQAVKDFCAARLAGFKVPSFVKFTNEPFPVNATNKVLKKQVREAFFPGS
ncbi:MAG: acyl--CoA ligase [Gammaproteobacteria bacterium]|uniref:class I adenylate-forming enzyme family protein n=1 Tax=Pseudomaricurvus alcaniphilus TaxID=1166482 RepID=UPI00140AF0B8|nr:class I adenylate-forming enzyme family protein [Pseudomaricurvus alcaniphilus]MBR9911104.1 acyl--CoA ligase [Gammaproteobacteria bacterium]NHN36392.1 acyl--CoA ligase [Pseudomaricurvus alcaniphilus]